LATWYKVDLMNFDELGRTKVLDFCVYVIYLTFLCTASFYYCMSLMWSCNWNAVCCDWRVGCAISGFRREVQENCVLLGYYTASSGNSLPTFRDNLLVPSLSVRNPKKRVSFSRNSVKWDCLNFKPQIWVFTG
jgi:hypothetical protein